MNNDLTDEQRARALELYNTWAEHHGLGRLYSVTEVNAHAWLAVEAHVLASHTRPDAESDARVRAWNAVAEHPFVAACHRRTNGGTFLDAVLAKLDAAHAHTCEPVWRPVSFDEIQSGWMIRSRNDDGFGTNWGVAHHQDKGGDWRTEEGAVLTLTGFGWTYETTAPEPEPEPDPRVDLLEGACLREGVVLTRSDAALLLSIADAAALDDYPDPDPACLIHDTTGEDVRGWEMADCTCPAPARPIDWAAPLGTDPQEGPPR